ncbi:hypothetical protein AAE478_003462 [Parahypoxylon ruwenzoriense]
MLDSNKLTASAAPGSSGAFRILDLSMELVLMILSFLSHEEIVLFSLTCKTASRLFCHLWPPHPKGGGSQPPWMPSGRFMFLDLLSVDLPYHFVCNRCRKLHSHRGLTLGGQCPRHNSIVVVRSHRYRIHKGTMTFGPLWPQYAFSHNEAREVMLCDRYGPECGLPISHLSISTDWKLARLGTACNNPYFIHGYVKLDTEAVVMYRSLFFHKIQRIWLLPDKLKSFLNYNVDRAIEQVFKSCCHETNIKASFSPGLHILDWRRLDGMCVRDTISEFQCMAQRSARLPQPAGLEGWDTDNFDSRPQTLGGCRHCMTDYAFTIHNHGRAGVEIIFDVFQDLGSCDSKTCNKWAYCWGDVYLDYPSSIHRRQTYPVIHPRLFPTAPGKSAKGHPSAPTPEDIWELHEYERRARLGRRA